MKNDATPKPGDVVNVHVTEPKNEAQIPGPTGFNTMHFGRLITETIEAGVTEADENLKAVRMFEMYLDADMMMCSRKWFYGVAQIMNDRLAKIESLEKELATYKANSK